MQMGRYKHAAMRVTGHKLLVIDGCSATEDWRSDVELLYLSGDDENVTSWRRTAPMLEPKKGLSICYFEGSVFVCCR